jgi:hypothetical protein
LSEDETTNNENKPIRVRSGGVNPKNLVRTSTDSTGDTTSNASSNTNTSLAGSQNKGKEKQT